MNKSESDPVEFIAKEISQVRKRSIDLQRQDMIYDMINIYKMKGMFSHWANLEAARDNTSDSLEPVNSKKTCQSQIMGMFGIFRIIHIHIRFEWSRGKQTYN